jgi:hypothetical protein
MPSNSTPNRPSHSTRSHELIILLLVLSSQFNEYIRGSPLPERLTSLWCFAACYYCVRAQHYPVPAPGSVNREAFYIVAFGVAAQVSFCGPESTGCNTATISWQRWLCTSGQRDHLSSRAAALLETRGSQVRSQPGFFLHTIRFRERFEREHEILLA